jgi:hypothetical protein
MLTHVQGVKEGWYDGTAILFAVLIVIVTTGKQLSSFLKCVMECVNHKISWPTFVFGCTYSM